MANVRETAARREAELRRRAERGDTGERPAPPVGVVVWGATSRALRRTGARWYALASGRWWERCAAVAIAVAGGVVLSVVLVGFVFVIVRDPTSALAGAGLVFFAVAFLRCVWWGRRP